jgi:hypothetical protein
MEQMLEDGAEAVAKKVIELAKGGDIQAARTSSVAAIRRPRAGSLK